MKGVKFGISGFSSSNFFLELKTVEFGLGLGKVPFVSEFQRSVQGHFCSLFLLLLETFRESEKVGVLRQRIWLW